MPRLRNISGLGALDITGVGVVDAGAEFDVTDEQAEGLVGQVENFEVVAGTAPVPPVPVLDAAEVVTTDPPVDTAPVSDPTPEA